MQTYGHYEFEDLLKDEENKICFDCGKHPAQWASVNNAIYLCLNCAGERYGVNVSYVRSITIDTWNDNQINLMRFGGNRNLRELLDVYALNRNKIEKTLLYNSRLLDFYRKHLKSKVNREPFEKDAPGKDEALKGLGIDTNTSSLSDSNKYASVSKSGTKMNKDKDIDKFKSVTSSDDKEVADVDTGFIGGLNSWMSKAVDSTKFIAGKVGDMELGNRIMTTGNVIGETGSNIVNKGTEAAKSEKVTTFAKKANDSINFVINKFFGGGKKNEEANDSSQEATKK